MRDRVAAGRGAFERVAIADVAVDEVPGSPLRVAVRAKTTRSWPARGVARARRRGRDTRCRPSQHLHRHPGAPVLEQIVERLLERNLRRPSELVAQPARIADSSGVSLGR